MTDNGLDFNFIKIYTHTHTHTHTHIYIYIEIIGLTLITIPAQQKTGHTIKSIAFRGRERVY